LHNGVACGRRQVVREHEAAEWVSIQISAMGVKLTSRVAGVEPNARLVHETSQLDVSRRFDKLNCSESSRRNNTGAMAWLGAIGYDYSLDITDRAVWRRRSPKTEILNGVNKHGLAL